MGRDWGNILLESKYSDEIEIYYVHPYDYVNKTHDEILQNADIVFYATLCDATILPKPLEQVASEKLFVVGIKNFGECNGNIYNRRFHSDYFSSSVRLGKSFVQDITYYEQNDIQKEAWGDSYIDMIAPIIHEDGTLPVFTADHRFISSDCEHLTQAGAQYYAELLELEWIVDFE